MARLKEQPEVEVNVGPKVEDSNDNSMFESENYAQGVKLAKEPVKVVELDGKRKIEFY